MKNASKKNDKEINKQFIAMNKENPLPQSKWRRITSSSLLKKLLYGTVTAVGVYGSRSIYHVINNRNEHEIVMQISSQSQQITIQSHQHSSKRSLQEDPCELKETEEKLKKVLDDLNKKTKAEYKRMRDILIKRERIAAAKARLKKLKEADPPDPDYFEKLAQEMGEIIQMESDLESLDKDKSFRKCIDEYVKLSAEAAKMKGKKCGAEADLSELWRRLHGTFFNDKQRNRSIDSFFKALKSLVESTEKEKEDCSNPESNGSCNSDDYGTNFNTFAASFNEYGDAISEQESFLFEFCEFIEANDALCAEDCGSGEYDLSEISSQSRSKPAWLVVIVSIILFFIFY